MRQLSRRHVTFVVSAVLALVLFVIYGSQAVLQTRSPSPSPPPPPLWSTSNPTQQLYGKGYKGPTNETLGFSKIFVVGLPERTDKRDAIALTSALTGFHVDWVDGVRGEEVPDKALPFGLDRGKYGENNLGSWRAHMNAIRRIVEEDLDSALIMEDDMDWDVRLKWQLEQVVEGVCAIFPPTSISPDSAWGDNWDLIWLGHCGELLPEHLEENKGQPPFDKFLIHDDATVPPRDKITGFIDWQQFPEFTRLVHVTVAPICTFAYALSRTGARKVLFDLSVDRLSGAFDNALAGLCLNAVRPAGDPSGLRARCVSVTPPVFFHHKAKGSTGQDSDIQNVGDKGFREKGTTENIVWSARNNLRNMLVGSAEMDSQFK